MTNFEKFVLSKIQHFFSSESVEKLQTIMSKDKITQAIIVVWKCLTQPWMKINSIKSKNRFQNKAIRMRSVLVSYMHSEKRDDVSIYINPKHDSKCEWRRVNANQRIPIVVTILERSSFSASLVRMWWTKKIHLWSKTKTDSWWYITKRISKSSAGKENVNLHKACLTKANIMLMILHK